MPFSSNLRMLRETNGLTQEQLANALGISKSAISMYEQGNREPDFETLETIADYFNIDIGLLFGRKSCNSTNKYLTSWGKPILDAYAAAIHPTQQAACAVLGIPHVIPESAMDADEASIDMVVFSFPAAAGIPLMAEDDYEHIEFPASMVPAGANFGVRIRGNSMEPTIKDGSIVFVRKQQELFNGQIGIFMIGDEAVCKRLYRKDKKILLKSDNPAYQDIEVKGDGSFYVAGKVLGYR